MFTEQMRNAVGGLVEKLNTIKVEYGIKWICESTDIRYNEYIRVISA